MKLNLTNISPSKYYYMGLWTCDFPLHGNTKKFVGESRFYFFSSLLCIITYPSSYSILLADGNVHTTSHLCNSTHLVFNKLLSYWPYALTYMRVCFRTRYFCIRVWIMYVNNSSRCFIKSMIHFKDIYKMEMFSI